MNPTKSQSTVTVPLYRAAHGRTGDKGNRSNISVIAWHADLYPVLLAQLSEVAVARHFAHRQPTRVQRFALPLLGAMNFVLDDVLDGGVNDALNLDTHGKALSYWLLDLPVEVPLALVSLLAGPELTDELTDELTLNNKETA
ncbi:MAG: hypothetical protein ACKVOT_15800 [Polaromonas sp.]